ncbi:hypothetical protein SSX86_020175 [Deinandra increscens subsp. villosa]|uniref:Uncharacterized protein n=1 Tax=Deinandra increscens subsp. villosa TaxID=3103831 RepID=A0AAP0GQL9_9ASTR
MNYFGDDARNEQSSRASSSSRKGKKSSADKPKQPQRGLGVAQLEKIRLHSQMGFHQTNIQQQVYIHLLITQLAKYDALWLSWFKNIFGYSPSSSFSYTSLSLSTSFEILMGMSELERSNMTYAQSQPSIDPRWNASNAMSFEAENYANPGVTMHLFQVKVEDSMRKKKWSDSIGSSSHNYDSNGSQELDLELRLSL